MAGGTKRYRYMLIGSLWVPTAKRHQHQLAILALREKYNIWGEMKWRKISPSSQSFYLELVDLYLNAHDQLRFRCIIVDSAAVDMQLHGSDGELGFYKFYYQVLRHWLLANHGYRIFCDLKSNRDKKRIGTLHTVLSNAQRAATIHDVQALPSSEVVLMQLCDVLLGAANARFNHNGATSPAKQAILDRIERGLGHQLQPTYASEQKYNVFKIRLT